jgi:hypothetical protein
VTCWGKIDYRQTAMTKTNVSLDPMTLAIGTTMGNNIRHLF